MKTNKPAACLGCLNGSYAPGLATVVNESHVWRNMLYLSTIATALRSVTRSMSLVCRNITPRQ